MERRGGAEGDGEGEGEKDIYLGFLDVSEIRLMIHS